MLIDRENANLKLLETGGTFFCAIQGHLLYHMFVAIILFAVVSNLKLMLLLA